MDPRTQKANGRTSTELIHKRKLRTRSLKARAAPSWDFFASAPTEASSPYARNSYFVQRHTASQPYFWQKLWQTGRTRMENLAQLFPTYPEPLPRRQSFVAGDHVSCISARIKGVTLNGLSKSFDTNYSCSLISEKVHTVGKDMHQGFECIVRVPRSVLARLKCQHKLKRICCLAMIAVHYFETTEPKSRPAFPLRHQRRTCGTLPLLGAAVEIPNETTTSYQFKVNSLKASATPPTSTSACHHCLLDPSYWQVCCEIKCSSEGSQQMS